MTPHVLEKAELFLGATAAMGHQDDWDFWRGRKEPVSQHPFNGMESSQKMRGEYQ
jgi:hypothetical protein